MEDEILTWESRVQVIGSKILIVESQLAALEISIAALKARSNVYRILSLSSQGILNSTMANQLRLESKLIQLREEFLRIYIVSPGPPPTFVVEGPPKSASSEGELQDPFAGERLNKMCEEVEAKCAAIRTQQAKVTQQVSKVLGGVRAFLLLIEKKQKETAELRKDSEIK